ncbi:MAG: hypothetical protein ACLR6J_14540 [Parabacteroides merdae]
MKVGAALYILPLMIGLGAQVGVKPAPEYMFTVVCDARVGTVL